MGRAPGPSLPDSTSSMSSTLAFDRHLPASPEGLLLMAEIASGLLVWVLVGGTEYSHMPALGWVMFVAILYWVLTLSLFIVYLSRAHVRVTWVPWHTVRHCAVPAHRSSGRRFSQQSHQRAPQLQLLGIVSEYSHMPALGWVMFVAILYWVLTLSLFIVYLSRAHVRLTWVPWHTVSVCFNSSATVLYLLTAAVGAASVSRATSGRHNYNCWASSAFFAFLTTLCYAGSSCLSYRAWRARGEEQ
ncbi:hypothetical protein CRUP_033888 [Coryphaenoides rupestris]|nr:hypothetical protein CRUP_033888 [Coryphaenoides rupestris]